MDSEHELLIEDIEGYLGRPMDTGEANVVKAVWYFCLGLKAKKQELEQENGRNAVYNSETRQTSGQ